MNLEKLIMKNRPQEILNLMFVDVYGYKKVYLSDIKDQMKECFGKDRLKKSFVESVQEELFKVGIELIDDIKSKRNKKPECKIIDIKDYVPQKKIKSRSLKY